MIDTNYQITTKCYSSLSQNISETKQAEIVPVENAYEPVSSGVVRLFFLSVTFFFATVLKQARISLRG
jgi:hypothetical protein